MTQFYMKITLPIKGVLKSFIAIVIGMVLLASSNTLTLAAPPENFQVQQIIGSGLNQPSGFEIAPDGRIFILQREGQIRVFKNGQLLDEPFADLPSVASGDRGLIGIALDPEYGINNFYVYFYYTGLDLRNRLVRFDATDDVGQNPLVIYQTNSPSQELHVGGSIRFGLDGKLYFAVGDNGYPPNAQNLSNPHGKILRINKDGSIPVDNPFFGQPGVRPEIWAYGFRNPWRFQFDSATGNIYGGDVGDYAWEEVNKIVKGGNYGWPAVEGMCTGLCPYINPIYSYNRVTIGDSVAVTGGPVYRGTMFPEEYRGDYFFGDYGQGFIRTMDLDANGNNLGVTDFDPSAGTVVDLKVAEDGSLYYLNIFPGALYRVSYSTDSSIPVANANADVTKGLEPLTVRFSSAGSMDPDEDPITYLWDFGDGTTSTDVNPTKTFTNTGIYTVQLTVSDTTSSSQARPIAIQVGIPPTVTIGSPTEGNTYRAGDEITINAHAIDGAGLDLSDANIKTTVFLHHKTHIHPFLGPLTGRANSFTTPDAGEASAETWFEIRVTATDSSSLSDTKSVNIFPIKSQMTFDTNVPGLKILLDGSPHDAPHTTEGVEKFKREISAYTVQEVNGQIYVFDHWSDNGAQRHEIITPADDTGFTVIYRPANPWSASYFNNPDLQGEPVLTREEAKIDYLWQDGSPDPLVQADNFSARWSKVEYFAGGRYKFTTATDDGVRLFVDGQVLIDHFEGNNAAFSGEINLTPGMHEIVMEYFEGSGLANARLEWDLAQDQPSETPSVPFQAEYFANKTLAGNAVLVRNDEKIDFTFGNGSPDPIVPDDQFSARWTKTEFLPSGIYEFSATADDGVRMYVDNELILDKWILQGPTEYTVEKALTEGQHTITVEYFENFGGSVIKASYVKKADLPVENGFIAEYYDNKTLTGSPVLTRVEASVNFDWKKDSPDPVVPVDAFSARFTKQEDFAEDGTYEFSVTADDGVRLYVDNELILDKWINQPATTYKVQKALTAGTHTVRIEYYDAWVDAVIMVSYGKVGTPPPPTAGIWTAEYHNNKALGAPIVLSRTDAAIDFDWGGGSPDPLINANDFSVRWIKLDTFEAAEYVFTTTADDGIRVYVDDELVVDEWHNQSPTIYTVTKAMAAGDHVIKVEYYENGGGAVAKVGYAKKNNPTPPPTDGYAARFWNIPNNTAVPQIPQTAPVVERLDATIDYDWKDQSPVAGINPDFFVAQWVKSAEFEVGTYTFTTISDDGVRVYVDNELVIDEWNNHSSTTHTGQKVMTAGLHTIRVEYYEKWVDAVAKFSYEKGTGAPQSPTEQPTIASYVYNDGLENDWVNWSWSSVVDFASTIAPFKNDKHIKWNPSDKFAGLYFHHDVGFNTAGYKEITFAVRATKANQKAEIIFFDDQNNTIGQPIKLATYGGDPVVDTYKIYVIPLSDLGASNRVIKGFHIKDISEEITNEIYVDSVGFVAQ